MESLHRSPVGYRGVNFSRRRTYTALVAPLAGARVRPSSGAATTEVNEALILASAFVYSNIAVAEDGHAPTELPARLRLVGQVGA